MHYILTITVCRSWSIGYIYFDISRTGTLFFATFYRLFGLQFSIPQYKNINIPSLFFDCQPYLVSETTVSCDFLSLLFLPLFSSLFIPFFSQLLSSKLSFLSKPTLAVLLMFVMGDDSWKAFEALGPKREVHNARFVKLDGNANGEGTASFCMRKGYVISTF